MGMDDLENEFNMQREEESDGGDQAIPGGFHGSMVTKEMLEQSRKEIANDINPDHKNDMKSFKPKGLSLDIEENSDYEN